MDNFLSASALLVAYAQQQITTVPEKNIRAAVNLEWAVNNALSPSVNIIFFDDVPVTDAGGTSMQGKVQASLQYWLVLVSIRNVADAGTAAQVDAGELIVSVLQALQGYPLSPQHQPLHRQKCPFRRTDKNGFAHFPFMFSTRIITTGSVAPR
ncbi:MAG: phage tail terminator protein [Methylobacter sp.]